MQLKRWIALGLGLALGAGCAATPGALAPRGPDFFPLTDGAYWFFEGIAGGDGVQVGIRVVGGKTDSEPHEVQIAWQAPGAAKADIMTLEARWRDGFLVLQDKPYQLRLIPERPKLKMLPWSWKSGADEFAGRIVKHDGFVAAPAGRWRDVLVVEIGPADGSPEQWRWHFVRGEGPVRIEVGEGEQLQVLELSKQGGPRALPSMAKKKTPLPKQPAAPTPK